MNQPRALIATIKPVSGGVPQMTKFIAETLEAGGIEPVLAYYEPYSVTPALSVPGFQLLHKRVGNEIRQDINGYESYAIGAWLPEFEFTHYLPTKTWRKLIDTCQYYISVSGNCLAGLPYSLTDKKFLAWVASSWSADRKDRAEHFPLHRRILDKCVNSPISQHMERKVLKTGTLLALSKYTRSAMNKTGGGIVCKTILPMPIDINQFIPKLRHTTIARVGFVGRIDDPRKNIKLLINAIAQCHKHNSDVTAIVIGSEPSEEVSKLVETLGLTEFVVFVGYVDRASIIPLLQSLDLFVVPSHQEGLCIAALEAMACGCPVVSTRCGGPEEFVLDNKTGFTVDKCATDMTNAILKIVENRELRNRLSVNARSMVCNNYDKQTALETLWNALRETYQ